MTTTTATKRYVNLGKCRTMLPGPDGQSVTVHPFEESLNPQTIRADANYVLEGDFWARYATGSYSQLCRFPRPSQYGRTSFPSLFVLREDGSRVELDSVDVDDQDDGQHVSAGRGVPRIAADVVTAEGMLRSTLPSGEVVLLEDTPENRNMAHSEVGVVNERNPEIREGIMQWLTDMHVETFSEFSSLSDDVLLKIPGVSSHNLPAIRENIGSVLRKMEELEHPEETPVGETAASATVRTTDDPLGGGFDDEPKSPVKKKAKKKAAKKKAKKKTAKKKVTKKATKKKATRRKASD